MITVLSLFKDKKTVKRHKIASLGRLFHSLISTVMMMVNILSLKSMDHMDDEFDNRWMNVTMFLIGLICKIPNIALTFVFKRRLMPILEEHHSLIQPGVVSVPEKMIHI